MALFFVEISNCPSILLGSVACGIISFVAIIPYANLFSYLDSIYIVPSDL